MNTNMNTTMNMSTFFDSKQNNYKDFSKTFYSKKAKLSSEELELIKINEEREKLKKTLEKNKLNKIKAFVGEDVVNHKPKKLTKFIVNTIKNKTENQTENWTLKAIQEKFEQVLMEKNQTYPLLQQ